MQNQNAKKCDFTIISAYSPKKRVQISFSGQGRTKQSHKNECDVNQIMARYLKTGILEFQQKNEPRYEDVTGFQFQSAMYLVAQSKTMFNELPALVRDRFDNEPANFFNFVNNPRNREECEEMGLLKPQAAPEEAAATPPAPPAPAKAPKAQAKPAAEPPADKTNSST